MLRSTVSKLATLCFASLCLLSLSGLIADPLALPVLPEPGVVADAAEASLVAGSADTSLVSSSANTPKNAEASRATDNSYLFQADDVLEVSVFREPDLTSNGMVRKDGMFDMKLLGPVPVAGRSVDQVTSAIREALARDYLVNPRVTITISAYARKKVNVLGEVRSPGLYAFPEHGTLALGDALAMAGGFLPTADPRRVQLRRTTPNGTVEQMLDASPEGEGSKVIIQPDDAISVALLQKRYFTVLGEVRNPALYTFPDHGTLALGDALAMAGGFLPTADSLHVQLRRTTPNGTEERVLDASPQGEGSKFILGSDDAISVPLLQKKYFTVLGQINRPGTYDVQDSRPLYVTDAIALAGGYTRLANASNVLLKRSHNGQESILHLNVQAMARSADTARVEIQNEDTITVSESIF